MINWKLIFEIICIIVILAAFVTAVVVVVRRQRSATPMEVGIEFEQYCAELLWKNGFQDVKMTSKTGDFGVDILAEKDGVTWAFQCKCYTNPVGIHAVQEIYSGRDFFRCMVGAVITNSTYTEAAKTLADAHNILLWDGKVLSKMERTGYQKNLN